MRKKIPAEISELITDLRDYAQNLPHWISEAEVSVREWIPSNELMVQFHPLKQEALTPGSDRWYTTKASWRSKDDAGCEYHHGFDDRERVRLVRFDAQLRQIYVYRDECVDELRLHGDSLHSAIRHRFSESRLVCSDQLHWPNLGLRKDDFAFEGDFLVAQQIDCWDINKQATSMGSKGVQSIFTFKWDDAQPVRKLREITSNFGELLYVGYHHRKLINRSSKSIVAFTLDVDDEGDEDGDGLAGQCYSLEMTADFDWEFDRILFAVPQAVYKITQESDVCNTGLEAGGHHVQTIEDVRAVSEQEGKWAWIDDGQANTMELVDVALKQGLKIVLSVSAPATFCQNRDLKTKLRNSALTIILSFAYENATQVRVCVDELRTAWNVDGPDVRILVPIESSSPEAVIDFIEQTTADGVYLHRIDLSLLIPLLNMIGLHSYASVPLKVDDHFILTESRDV